MSIAGRLSSRKLLIGGAILGLVALGAGALLWPSSSQQIADASFLSPLPPRPPEPGKPLRAAFSPEPATPVVEGKLANPAFTAPASDPLKPNEPDLRLVDASPFGPLPRIAEDGRKPVEAYARPYERAGNQPKIAILVTGLGQQTDATNASFHLPGAISLMFSPYAEDLPVYFERARLAGHEVLLELPMEPSDYPSSDPGPHTLRASGTVDANIERLNWVLARAPGYFAVAGQGGAFAGSQEAEPIMQALATKGLGMIEINGNGLAATSGAAGLTYLTASDWIDSTPSAEAIDQALAELEAKAEAEGYALGVAEAYPITLKRLVEWSTDLAARGIALVPVSAILLETSSSAVVNDQAPNLAQSRN